MLPVAYPLGPFLVEPAGRLTFRDTAARPQFSFIWRKHRIAAVLANGSVALTASLGHVPSTAAGPERRRGAMAALQALPAYLPKHWLLRLTRDHRVELVVEHSMEYPTNAVSLMQPLVAFVLQLSPFLDLMEEAGF